MQTKTINVDLTNLPAVTNDVYIPYFNNDSRYLILYGGAGSGKSFYAAEKLIYRIVAERNHRFLVVRKVGSTLRDSVFFLLRDVIRFFGLTDYCIVNKTDMTMQFPLFNSEILFKSVDEPEKLKSIANVTGLWVEEASELKPEDFRQLNLRLRGNTQNYKQIILTFNPISAMSWLKAEFFDAPKDNQTIVHTTYKDNKFLDAEYIAELEALKEIDFYYYQVYCLGEWGVIGNLILSNWAVEDISQDASDYDHVSAGLDFGFNHPSAYLDLGIKDDELYIFNELYERNLTNTELIERVKDIRLTRVQIMGDSAEPARIKEFNQASVSVKGAQKPKDSVQAQIDWLRRRKIHIHPSCVNTINEIRGWKYKEDKDGNVLEEPVPYNDDAMAALRYGIEPWRLARVHNMQLDLTVGHRSSPWKL